MRFDHRLYSKNVYGVVSSVIWLLTTFIFAIDIIHYLKLYTHVKSYKITALNNYHHNVGPFLTINIILIIFFIVGSLAFFGNLALLSYKKLKKYYTFIIPLLAVLIVLVIIAPLTIKLIDLIYDRPFHIFEFTIVSLDLGFPNVIINSLSADIFQFIQKNLPYVYPIYWLELTLPLVASVFQYLGILKIESKSS